MTATQPQYTDFSVDVLGRYVCNGFDEMLQSADRGAHRKSGEGQEDARSFDVVIIGGGTFGAITAAHLLELDRSRAHRILVLDGGRMALGDHVQNLAMLTKDFPVWGVPWTSDPAADLRFPGLAFCLGGRSSFAGSWTPLPVEGELGIWPPEMVRDLRRELSATADLLGTSESNDFLQGPLQSAVREQLRKGLGDGKVKEWAGWADSPLHLRLRQGAQTDLQKLQRLKLEAPLAMASRAQRGAFPAGTFSSMPLLAHAARQAFAESQQDDLKKRLMVVPSCFVLKMETAPADQAGKLGRVVRLLTNRGSVHVPEGGVVVLAAGTVESTRLALQSFGNLPCAGRLGQNLMAHVRSTLVLRMDRRRLSLLDTRARDLGVAALLLRGRHKDTQDGRFAHFQVQILVSGVDATRPGGAAELYRQLPDHEQLEQLGQASETHVVVALSAVGEMRRENPRSHITLDGTADGFGQPKAFVTLVAKRQDLELWEAMDRSLEEVAAVLHGGPGYEVVHKGRERLGTSHSEAGTLGAGNDPAASVTNPVGRFHDLDNCYVAGPAMFPTVTSAGPVLLGSAFARRLAQHLNESLPRHRSAAEPGFRLLFDGQHPRGWQMSTISNQPGERSFPGGYHVVDGALEVFPGNDVGMLYCDEPIGGDFTLRVEWRVLREDASSGVLLGFPDPRQMRYDNSAYVALQRGFEVVIDYQARPDGLATNRTGAVRGLAGPADGEPVPLAPVGQWNTFVIELKGTGTPKRQLRVWLNPRQQPMAPLTSCEFTLGQDRESSQRGVAVPSLIGLRTGNGRVAFRNLQVRVER